MFFIKVADEIIRYFIYTIYRGENMRIDAQHNSSNCQPIRSETIKSVENHERETSANLISQGEIKPEEKDITQAVNFIGKALKVTNSHLEFTLHERSGRYQIRIVEDGTSEVLREIPAEQILEVSAMIKEKLDEMVGLLVDKVV